MADPTNANPGYYIDETPSSGHTGWNYLTHYRDWKYGEEHSWVEFTITVPSAGNYPLSIRYAQDISWLQDIDLEVTVNSTAGGSQVQIFNTGWSMGSNDWRYTPYYYYDLDAGENKVRVRNTLYYGAKIDHLRVGKAKATIINVDGHNRTVVHDRVHYTEGFETNSRGDGIEYSDFNNKIPYEFCDYPVTPIEAYVEGRVRVRPVGETYCGNEAIISVLNPMVDWSGHEDQVPDVLFTGLPNLDDPAWVSGVNDEQDFYKALNGFDFQLTTGIEDPTSRYCAPATAPVDGTVNVGLGYLNPLENGHYYEFNGSVTEPLNLVPGNTYRFNRVANGHPFAIKGCPNLVAAGSGDSFTYTIPNDRPLMAPYVDYVCTAHPEMRNSLISIVDHDVMMYDSTMCMNVPTSAEEGNKPVFAKLSDGTYLQWTPQLILEENTVESPIADGGGEVQRYTDVSIQCTTWLAFSFV